MAVIITTEADKNLASMVKELDKTVGGNKDAWGFLILLTEDKAVAKEKLTAFAKENGIANVAMTMKEPGKPLPEWLKYDPADKHTIVLYKERKVTFAKGFKTIDEAGSKEVLAKASELMKAAGGAK